MCSSLRVSTAIDSLPSDIEGLRAWAAKAIAERDALIAERDAERAEKEKLQNLYEQVRHQLKKAIDHRFGARSEPINWRWRWKMSRSPWRKPKRAKRKSSPRCPVRVVHAKPAVPRCLHTCRAFTRQLRRMRRVARAAARQCM